MKHGTSRFIFLAGVALLVIFAGHLQANPTITTQPASSNVIPGATATFSVAASGVGALSYQWLFDGSPISGATSNIYVIDLVASSNYGSYSVTVEDTSGTVTSSTAFLTISTNLQLWLRADTGITTSGGPISQWSDQTTNNNNATQSSAPNRPSLITNALNGEPAVHFIEADGQFLVTSNFPASWTAAEAFVVTRAASASPSGTPVLWQVGAEPTFYPYSDGTIRDHFGATAAVPYNVVTPATSLTNFLVYNEVSTSTEWTCRINGFVQYTTSVNVPGFSTPYIGWQAGTGNTFDGDITEIMLFDRELSQVERQMVVQYLNAKYQCIATSAPATPTNLTTAAISASQEIGLIKRRREKIFMTMLQR